MSVKQQPKRMGVVRKFATLVMHEEVIDAIKDIAERENKTFSYIVAEIVYSFFGLEVKRDAVKIARSARKASTRKGHRAPARRDDGRVALENLLRFEARRDAS